MHTWSTRQNRKEERSIYYISKKFNPYESRYTLLERMCCALTYLAQKMRHYLSSDTTYLISGMDPLKYIFQKAMSSGKLAKWQILLSEFDIMCVIQKATNHRLWMIIFQKIPLMKSMNHLKLIFMMEKSHLLVKIFLKSIQVEDYSLMERQIIKVKVLERY